MTATKKTTAKKPARKTATKKVTFVTNRPGSTLIRLGQDYVYNAQGRVIGTEIVEDDGSPAEVQFDGPVFETDDPKLIEFLREHDDFNNQIWEQGAAPDEPKPTFSEQMDAIVAATAVRDGEALKAVLKEEEETHNRPQIVNAAESAIARIEEAPVELDGATDRDQITATGGLNRGSSEAQE